MPNTPSQLTRLRSAWAAGVLVAAGLAAWCSFDRDSVSVDEKAGVVSCRVGDLLYEFHGATASEALFDLRNDRRCVVNVISQRPEDAARIRELVKRDVGSEKLEALCDRFAPSRARLAALGYL